MVPSRQRGRSRVVLGSRGERGAALGLALRVLAGGPLGALCRGKWPDAMMSLECRIIFKTGSRLAGLELRMRWREFAVSWPDPLLPTSVALL